MSDPFGELSQEEMEQVWTTIIATAIKLLIKKPVWQPKPEIGDEKILDVPVHIYESAFLLKATLVDLLGGVGDSLYYNNLYVTTNPAPCIIIEEDGGVSNNLVAAISFRVGVDLNFPEFTKPFTEELRKAVESKPITARIWQLTQGPGKSVHLTLYGKPSPLPIPPTRRRATAVRVTYGSGH